VNKLIVYTDKSHEEKLCTQNGVIFFIKLKFNAFFGSNK